MRREFNNYYGLKRYLTVVAQNNNHDINFDNYEGLETIYKYLHLHKDKLSYNFNFTEWVKLSVTNNIDELEQILNFKEELQGTDIELSRMSSAYILLLLSYMCVNMNRNSGKPLCCYRLYQSISEDIGLSER